MEEVKSNNLQPQNQQKSENYAYNPDQILEERRYKKIGYAASLVIIGILLVTVIVLVLLPHESENQTETLNQQNNDNTVQLLSNTNDTNQTNETVTNVTGTITLNESNRTVEEN